MSEMIHEALQLAYDYSKKVINPKFDQLLREHLLTMAGCSKYEFNSEITKDLSYVDVQRSLSRLNERESIRKKKGVYYTPVDVVEFIVSNTVKGHMFLPIFLRK